MRSIRATDRRMAALSSKCGEKTSLTLVTTLDATSVQRVCRLILSVIPSWHACHHSLTSLRRPFLSPFQWTNSKILRRKSISGTITGLRSSNWSLTMVLTQVVTELLSRAATLCPSISLTTLTIQMILSVSLRELERLELMHWTLPRYIARHLPTMWQKKLLLRWLWTTNSIQMITFHISTTNLLNYLTTTTERALLVEAPKLLFSAQSSSKGKI